MNPNETPKTETTDNAAASAAWAQEVAEYLSGADDNLARELDDRPAACATKSEE